MYKRQALYPYELVTYGETGQVCQNWMQYRLIKQYLEELTQEQTCLLYTSWSSAGKMGFRGSKKNTPYAAQMAAQDCAKIAFDLGLRKVKAYVKGPGNGQIGRAHV